MEKFNVLASVQKLQERHEGLLPIFSKYLAEQKLSSDDRNFLMNDLSIVLLNDEYTLAIASLFSPMLLDLVSRASDVTKDDPITKHEWLCICLSKLIFYFPDIARFAKMYFEKSYSFFYRFEDDSEPQAKKMKSDMIIPPTYKLLKAANMFLLYDTQCFKDLCDWSVLVAFLNDKDALVRWFAYQCLGRVGNIKNISSLLKNKFTSEEHLLCTAEEMDSQMWNYNHYRPFRITNAPDVPELKLHSMEMSKEVVNVAGVILSLNPYHGDTVKVKKYVHVPSIKKCLHRLCLAVSSGEPVLLQGAVGCGKTSIIEYLASVTGRKPSAELLKVQLGDHMDSKMLLGTHCCTEIPGEFVWKPGILIQAMTEGHWLLLEDIDRAPMDVVSLLVPVLQARTVVLPGHANPIKAAAGFQLFTTQRLIKGSEGSYVEFKSHTRIIDKQFRKILMESLTREELKTVICAKWPKMEKVCDKILDLYSLFSLDFNEDQKPDLSGSSNEPFNLYCRHGRLVSTRDLFKFCDRISEYFDGGKKDVSESVFQNALECFCDSIPSDSTRLTAAESIGVKFNIPNSKAQHFCQKNKPSIVKSENEVVIGRVSFEVTPDVLKVKKHQKAVFAPTRHSLALLEKIAVAVAKKEPVLLVGETGTGKTSTVQYLADLTKHKLTVINMSQQSDSVDLIGGYKPTDLVFLVEPLRNKFLLMCNESEFIPVEKNTRFLEHIMNTFFKKKYDVCVELMLYAQNNLLNGLLKMEKTAERVEEIGKWKSLGDEIETLFRQIKKAKNILVFKFIEGALVKAMKNGHWLLLDEINLAEAETLECLSGVLENNPLFLYEKGSKEPVKRHSNFRVFACMNPATDIGKKDLPVGIRNRFTEFFVDEIEEPQDLSILVREYLKNLNLNNSAVDDIVEFYLHVKKISSEKLSDGTGHYPHFSLRTLCRALKYASTNPCHNVPRSLYEAFCLSFLSQLDAASHPVVQTAIRNKILGKNRLSLLNQSIPEPGGKGKYIPIQGYWIQSGRNEPSISENYIFTPTVQQNLQDLARIVSASRFPVLLQGETSVGKTSLIQWLAKATGNTCVRVNNHEHTDIQEYIGTYTADSDGVLQFKEGVLPEAMRRGYWIILDELNLAPTEVMEALNRVLDDNRELFIPETQTTVTAKPGFMIFATQNPPGLYGGRKLLSRAFRNRFIELHFNEIPASELKTILHKRCKMSLSYSEKLVAVMSELQLRRRESGVFCGKQGYITLRDLFRWGERYEKMEEPPDGMDWLQYLAEEGYLLLAGRVRHVEEERVICEAIEKHFKRKVDPELLFNLSEKTPLATRDILVRIYHAQLSENFSNIVWTYNMRRLAVLVGKAMQYKEPVLLIGDTGCGKTTICQIYAELSGKKLHSVNCHMHSESSDFLGGLRPVRDQKKRKSKLFEWVDGPLIQAMQRGDFFLADEISLADDSVLERLNSVLEPEQKILLAEKSFDDCEQCEVTAAKGFHFLATMNPGGDYGKKELSPALRNRFTEIWCPNSITSLSDISAIVDHNITRGLRFNEFKRMKFSFGHLVTEFMSFFMNSDFGKRVTVSIRDILTWVEFINVSQKCQLKVKLHPAEAFCHGAFLAFLDGLGSGASSLGSEDAVLKVKKHCLDFLIKLVGRKRVENPELIIPELLEDNYKKLGYEEILRPSKIYFGLGPFGIECPHDELFNNLLGWEHNFQLEAKTTKANIVKILRAMQLPKPILLEGSPGVGKSTLVRILARGTGHDLVRINLSEQTDISDLFGADLPVEGGEKGEFAWRDGPIIQALKKGEWILLDELNLASQSVLEGLNALLDHRNEVYIPELGKTFHLDKTASRIFCCQNPQRQGGSRKGLPRSFLNRFTQVYMKQMEVFDFEYIATSVYKTVPPHLVSAMVLFNHELSMQVNTKRLFGHQGSPWEFNLRDIFRWCDCMIKNQSDSDYNIGEYVKLIYVDRMRTKSDREKTLRLFEKVIRRYGLSSDQGIKNRSLKLNVFNKCVQLGYSFIPCEGSRRSDNTMTCVTPSQLPYLESLMKCIEMNWMAILVGPSGSGKSTLVRTLAELCGKQLHILSVNSEMDTIELLGGFEQADSNRQIEFIAQDLEPLVEQAILKCVQSEDTSEGKDKQLQEILYQQHNVRQCMYSGSSLQQENCIKKLNCLKELIKTLESFELENSKDVLSSSQKAVDNLVKISTSKEFSGGKFEWVDSILITAVQKGHWLLIDDANFCSSSVLDRLNALLEPEGVLTINEQGIVDGKLRKIAPHPDFRIILTLNPQNGEISRAMRNRGIEIYMEPVKNENIPNQDVFNLALFAQCKGFIHEKLLLHFCLLYSNLSACPQIEHPCLSDFISAASLCVQHVQKHGNPARAFRDSCLSVFAESNLNAHARQVATRIINAEAHRVATEPLKIDYSIPITELLPTSFDYYQNSLLSMFKKQSCLFTVYFKGFIGRIVDCPPFPEDPDSRPVFICRKPACFSYVQPTCFRNDVRRLTVVMRILFESSSLQSFEYLSYFILKNVETYVLNFKHSDPNIKNLFHILGSYKDVVKQVANAPLMKNLIETVKDIFKETNFQCIESSEAPFDLRWNSDLYHKLMILLRQKHDDPDSIEFEFACRANRCSLLLLFRSLTFVNDMMPNIPNSKNLAICAEEVVKNPGLFRNSPLLPLVSLPRFIEACTASIVEFMEDESMPCSDDYYWKLYDIISSYHIFQRIYLMHAEKGMESQLTFLSFHFTWLLKKLQNLYEGLCSMPPALAKCAEDTQTLLKCNAPGQKLRKKCLKWFGSPPIFADDRAAEISRLSVQLYETLDLVKRIKSPNMQLKDLKTIKTNMDLWFLKLSHVTFTSIYGNEFKPALSDVQDIRIQLLDAGVISTDDDDIMEVAVTPAKLPNMSDSALVVDVHLLPLWDYLFVVYEADLLSHVCMLSEQGSEKGELALNSKLGDMFKCWGSQILGLNPVHLSHFVALQEIKCKKSLAPSLLYFLRHLRHGFSSDGLSALDFEIVDSGAKIVPRTNEWTEDYSWAKQQPLFTHIFSSLFGTTNSSLMCQFPLGTYSERIEQLKKAQGLVWKHFDKLANAKKNTFRYHSASIVVSWFNCLLSAVASIENTKSDVLNKKDVLNLFDKLKITPFVTTSKGNDNILLLATDAIVELRAKLVDGYEDSNLQWIIGRAYILVGLLTYLLLMPRDYVDPGTKAKAKLVACKDTLHNIGNEIEMRRWVNEMTCGQSLYPDWVSEHPHVRSFKILAGEHQKKFEHMDKKVPFRSNENSFYALKDKLAHFTEKLLSPDMVLDILSKLLTVNDYKEESQPEQQNDPINIVQRALQYTMHLQNFADEILKEYALFPDLLVPYLVGIEQIIFGISLTCYSVRIKEVVFPKQTLWNINEFLERFTQFTPNEWTTSLHVAPWVLSSAALKNFKLILSVCKDQFPDRGRLYYKFIKSAVLDIINEIKIQGCQLESKLSEMKELLFSAFQSYYRTWHIQDEVKKKKKAEEEKLFKIKRHEVEKSDEEKMDKALKEMFPLYEEEFSDIADPETDVLKDNKKPTVTAAVESEAISESDDYMPFTEEDMFEVCQLHATVIHMLSDSKSKQNKNLFIKDDHGVDIITPFLLRHEVISTITTTLANRLDANFEKNLIIDQLLLSQELQKLKGMEGDEYYDIYHDPNPSRVLTIAPMLNKLVNHVKVLLQEFPENPNLIHILTVTNRVLSFPVSDPLMKFVVGLELILESTQVWEQNAHSKVSLKDEMEEITKKIIECRAMELDGWKKGLQNVIKKQYVKSSKWWFFMFPLFYTDNTYAESEKAVIVKGLQQCLEDSPIGEFPARLNILHTFLQEFQLQPGTKLSRSYANILFNVYTYYKQFLPAIENEIALIRKPIEKELKDYVKIARWNDINFYAVKKSVEKSHRTVLKHVKAFEDALLKPAKTAFILPSKSNMDDKESSWSLDIQKKHYISRVPKASASFFTERSEVFFQKFPIYQKKAVKRSKEIAETFPVASYINSLNDFCGNIIEALEEVTAEGPKSVLTRSREKKQTLLRIQNKKQMLSILCKNLKVIGLSYRQGMIKYKEDKATELMSVPAFDISKMKVLKHDSSFKELLSQSSRDTNHYFYKSLAQYAQLQRLMESPFKGLTLDIVHRIQGYSCHLLNLVSAQRYRVVKMSHDIDKFGCFLSTLSCVFEKREFAFKKNLTIIPPQEYFLEAKIDISNILGLITITAGQFDALLDCTPESKFFTSQQHSPCLDDRSLSGLIKNDEGWTAVKKAVNVFNCDIKYLLLEFSDLNLSENIVSWDHFRSFTSLFSSVQTSMEKLIMQISEVCEPKCAMALNLLSLYNKVCDKYNYLNEEADKILESQVNQEKYENPANAIIVSLCQKLTTEVLLAIQDLSVLSTTVKEDRSDENVVPDNLFTAKITNYLLEVEKCLRFKKISKLVKRLKFYVKRHEDTTEDLMSIDSSFKLLVHLAPLLNQYYQLTKVYLAVSLGMHRTSSKFLTILLEVFTILATKGFCIPPELEEEAAKDGGTKFEDIESGGLGEGEGSKDVSKDIQSEDQLDDAIKEGQEKKDDAPKDKDLKDEDDGIEMSDDIDGKIHSGEGAKDSDDEEDEDDNEGQDLDKQMGDVETEESEKLDDKVWGSDTEDEEDLREDEGSGGMTENAPSELAAKDKRLEDNDREEGKEDKGKKNQPQDAAMDETNEEYTGEKPDPMINAPPTQEPEIEELPENMEITEEIEKDDGGENLEEMNEVSETLDEVKEEEEMKDGENEEAEKEGNKGEEEAEGESEDTSTNITDQHEPSESTDESNMETNESALPTQTPTEQEKALPSEMKMSSSDPVATEENMDWENGTQNAEEQHKQGLSDSKDMPSEDPGHEGKKSSGMRREAMEQQRTQKMKLPGEKRTVDESTEEVNVKKKHPVLDRKEGKDSETNANEGESADMYEHVSKEEKSTMRAMDIATKEEAEIRTAQFGDDDDDSETSESEDEVIELSSSDEDEKCNKAEGETTKAGQNQKSGSRDNTNKEKADIPEGSIIMTKFVPRGNESSIHTQNELWKSLSLKGLLSQKTASTSNVTLSAMIKTENFSDDLWKQHELAVSNLSQELCEQLRLVLEPTKMSKFKGDYRTGKRLNMRKIIPYIASQFRKDKIWLRRTKPTKRQYQIMLAMDDSSSMADNKSKKLAFDSLVVLGQSLTLLEAGELSVVSFGEKVTLLHGFNDQFSPNAGARILEQMTFAQKGTKIAQLLNFATETMVQARSASHSSAPKETAQLLVIISDGRNIFSEGEKKVNAAVKEARDNNVFMVFLILDNPDGNHSILDIQSATFEDKDMKMVPYMDKFPFPFYIILREITALPQVLGEALRQWFELVTSVDR